MRSIAPFFLIVFMFAAASQAKESVYFKVANGDDYLSFFDYAGPATYSMVQEIAMRTLKKPFIPDNIRTEYYQLLILHGVVWQGMNVVQYDYVPLNKDRFRHVFWVEQDSVYVYKLDIYDLEGKLLYSAVSLDDTKDSNLAEAKKKLPEDVKGYFGFVNVYSETLPNGTVRMLFTDGLNRFSVFRSPYKGINQEAEKLIVYGNYVYNKIVPPYRYTVVGSIPFDKMEEVINLLFNTPETDGAAVEQTLDNLPAEKR